MRIHSACVSKIALLHECNGYDPGARDQARSAPIMFTPTGREVPSNEVTAMNEQHPAIDALSTSVAETIEEAIINALCTARPIEGAMAIARKPCRLTLSSPSYSAKGSAHEKIPSHRQSHSHQTSVPERCTLHRELPLFQACDHRSQVGLTRLRIDACRIKAAMA
jgi:hypothetical protein